MSIYRTVLVWLLGNAREPIQPRAPTRAENTAPDFLNVTWVDRAPSNADVQPRQLYCILAQKAPRWALFQCPCKCGCVITLSLQIAHVPHWNVYKGRGGLPSIYPSIWRNSGCYSHFWIEDGRIVWCGDTGTRPVSRNRSFRAQE